MRYRQIGIIVVMLFSVLIVFSQKNRQEFLEKKKKELMEEVKHLNELLKTQKANKKSILDKIEKNLTEIRIQKQLISVIDHQISDLSQEIINNKKSIEENNIKLIKLKKEYGNIIKHSYKSKSIQNRLMFILSSQNFIQAYRRLEYMKQYSSFRKKQALEIEQTNKEIKQLNVGLKQKIEQQKALKKNGVSAQNQLKVQKIEQQKIVVNIKKKESTYRHLIKEKLQKAQQIDKQIETFIKKSIEESNTILKKKNSKISKKGGSNSFALTPETKLVSNSFLENKGKLLWPVNRGTIIRGYGKYTDPVYPKIKYYNNGITIATSKGESARAVFKGEVSGIQQILGGNKAVQIRHGEYITTYYNLSEVHVYMGEKVKAKDVLGSIYTNRNTNKTELKFYVYKNTTKLNPEDWISK